MKYIQMSSYTLWLSNQSCCSLCYFLVVLYSLFSCTPSGQEDDLFNNKLAAQLDQPLLVEQVEDSLNSRLDRLIEEANLYLATNDPRREVLLDSAIQLAHNNKRWEKLIEIHRYHRLTHLIYFNKTELWKKELLLIDSLISRYQDELGPKALLMANNNRTQWGIYYSIFGNDQFAIDLVKNAIKELESSPVDSANLYNLYYNSLWLASMYHKIGSFEAAIQENQRALIHLAQLERIVENPNRFSKASIYMSIANSYLLQWDTAQAVRFYHRAETALDSFMLDPENKPRAMTNFLNMYSGMARYYHRTKQYKKAIKALQVIEDLLQPNDPFTAKTMLSMGDIHLESQDFEEAMEAYLRSRVIYITKSTDGVKDYFIAQANIKLGHLCATQKKWSNALRYYQTAITNVVSDFDDTTDVNAIPARIEMQKIIGRTELLQALKGKTSALMNLYEEDQQLDHLVQAQQTNNLSLTLIDSIKNDLFLDKDRQFQMSDHYAIYEQGMLLANQLFANTGDVRHLNRAWHISEQSKSLTLLSVFQPNYVEDLAVSTFSEKERQIKYEIAKRKEWLISKRLPLNEDSLFLSLQYRYEQWQDEIRNTAPDYLDFRLDKEVIDIGVLQDHMRGAKQAAIEYFWGEHYFFTILITPDSFHLYQQEIGALTDSLRLLHELAADPGWRTKIDASIRFQNLSHNIFKTVLEEPLETLDGAARKLLIVRDGPLSYLPFEMLDIAPEVRPGIFSTDEFLLESFVISYANSVTLLHRQAKTKQGRAPKRFAGFAPTYKAAPDTLMQSPLAALVRSNSLELKENRNEVRAIANVLGGSLFLGEEANEANFKENAHRYDILHLAMHGLADHERPEMSILVFAKPKANSREDGVLRAIELYNMKFQAQMAVLSACQTADGKSMRGEGILSLSHAFTYAGVPSIVASQWNANDAATAIIMTHFYQNLKAGDSKDEALFKAKQSFLKEHPHMAHPFYWANFVAIGDMAPMKFINLGAIYFWIVTLALLLLILLFRKKRNRSS